MDDRRTEHPPPPQESPPPEPVDAPEPTQAADGDADADSGTGPTDAPEPTGSRDTGAEQADDAPEPAAAEEAGSAPENGEAPEPEDAPEPEAEQQPDTEAPEPESAEASDSGTSPADAPETADARGADAEQTDDAPEPTAAEEADSAPEKSDTAEPEAEEEADAPEPEPEQQPEAEAPEPTDAEDEKDEKDDEKDADSEAGPVDAHDAGAEETDDAPEPTDTEDSGDAEAEGADAPAEASAGEERAEAPDVVPSEQAEGLSDTRESGDGSAGDGSGDEAPDPWEASEGAPEPRNPESDVEAPDEPVAAGERDDPEDPEESDAPEEPDHSVDLAGTQADSAEGDEPVIGNDRHFGDEHGNVAGDAEPVREPHKDDLPNVEEHETTPVKEESKSLEGTTGGDGHGLDSGVPHQGDDGVHDPSGSSVAGSQGDAPDASPGGARDQPMDPKVVDERIKELDDRQGGQGHAPGRHLHPDNKALTDRLGTVLRDSDGAPKMYGPNSNYPGLVKSENNIDPLTGTTVDGVSGGVHRVGAFATRFDNAEDMVRADAYFRDEMARTGYEPMETPIEDVLGPGAHERFTGYYRDPANLNEFKPVDFEGGTILPVYRLLPDGQYRLHTMFASPAPGRHP
ncbi:hypothetical protein Q3V23_14690 [Streptomyces sp. VNUA116]|uniref:hypothetical protein n=1 Tax=Streptomyces sp. VNUA116 TaxID=3062449 RepID=UPI002675E0AF|nr:hypothetical protein [Streptomyces sp. VNUA116]WKU45216.1 hypothetical protein Q3V23_14690 [Streptomyces sp. VNUA116]